MVSQALLFHKQTPVNMLTYVSWATRLPTLWAVYSTTYVSALSAGLPAVSPAVSCILQTD